MIGEIQYELMLADLHSYVVIAEIQYRLILADMHNCVVIAEIQQRLILPPLRALSPQHPGWFRIPVRYDFNRSSGILTNLHRDCRVGHPHARP